MKRNLVWAVAYNTVYPAFGLLLRPEVAALSMAGSSLLVAVNALLLKRTRLPGIRATRPGALVAAPPPAAAPALRPS